MSKFIFTIGNVFISLTWVWERSTVAALKKYLHSYSSSVFKSDSVESEAALKGNNQMQQTDIEISAMENVFSEEYVGELAQKNGRNEPCKLATIEEQ